MDVERIQKINDLAVDLMKQGLAADRETAIKQAEQIYSGGEERKAYDELRDTMAKVDEQRNPEPEPEEPQPELSQDDIKNILKQNTDYIVKKFKEFEEKIEFLERELSSVRTKMTYNRLPTAEQITAQKPQEDLQVSEAEQAPAPQAPAAQGEAKQGPNHPRSGAYKDSDVSIEKFFYMGAK